ncbi:DUF1540 domain-containing protein [Clostridium fermenticellae]|uniref:DUF1540 domain-containing protein n=1 Tax=Clostridium fermenticellae TaxID=2068654 RepID=A0A386H3B6_9CLOT|nr:DUF1540 domain-containing protein [Clostridium fermenticellae]AYD39985.1 DUF1540 domain-containing protein [Clostridium fermenticellae]
MDNNCRMQVKCGVDSCHYWQDSMCHADQLEVNPMSGKANPHTSDDTCCKTFKPCR